VNLLIVDDHPSNLKLLRAALEAEGHTVSEARNGIEALQNLEREMADALISDVLMPGMDGFRLCHEIRQNDRLCMLPLILYTATYNSPTDRQLAASVGADAYILKPAPARVLLDAIQSARQSNAGRKPQETAPLGHVEILERYNAVLVRKLESRNSELQLALSNLRASHEQILDLNRNLETRVTQRTAALDAANRELEAFSFSVSHDLRAPLRHIAGFAELLASEVGQQTSADARALCGRIIDSTQHMHRLIEALLELARMGRTPLQLADIDLEKVLDEALEAVAPETATRNMEWRRSRLPHVLGDGVLLRQVLINLLSNAIKYTRTRNPAIIEIGQRSGRADEVVVFVKDNGVGFDLRRAGELFGVFKRLHGAEAFEGIGIGLANVHRIITRHGGSIWADAAVERGATFFFSLRRAEAA
jgi:signal transduction histidine kinase